MEQELTRHNARAVFLILILFFADAAASGGPGLRLVHNTIQNWSQSC
jgi:hypothetical protein